MIDNQSSYNNTNKLLLNTLKSGIAKEKKAISKLTARETSLQAKLDHESKQIQAGKLPEKKKELAAKIVSYRQELKFAGAELISKKQALEHSLSTFKALKRELSQKNRQQEHAEKELEKELNQLVLHQQREVTKEQHEKTRHSHHIEKIKAEKQKVHARIDKELQGVEATLRKDKQEQENRVLAVDRSIKELSRQKTSIQHQASSKYKVFSERTRAIRSEQAFIEWHLLKVKNHLIKHKPGLRDPVFNSLIKNWFRKQGQLRDKERGIYAKAESREREINTKVESTSHRLRKLQKQLSAVETRVKIKEHEFEQLTSLEQNQQKLTSALKKQKEWLRLLQKNLTQAREKQHALNLAVVAEEEALQEKNKLKHEEMNLAKKSFMDTLSSFENPTYQKKKSSVGDELNKIKSLNQEIMGLQKAYGADNEAKQQLKDKVHGLSSSVSQINRKIELLTNHITKNNSLLEKHQNASQFLHKEESLLKEISLKIGIARRLKQSQLKSGKSEKIQVHKQEAQLEKERNLSLHQMLANIQKEGEKKLRFIASRILQERKKKQSFYTSVKRQKLQLVRLISKQEHLLAQKQREGERNIAKLREQKSSAIKVQGKLRLAELQKKIKEEDKLKKKLEKSMLLEGRKLNKHIALKRTEFSKEKSLLLKKARALRLKRDSTNKHIVSAHNRIELLGNKRKQLDVHIKNALLRKKELEDKIALRETDLKALNQIVKDKLARIEEQKTLRKEMHQLHNIINHKIEPPVIKVVTKVKTQLRYRTKTKLKYQTRYKFKTKLKYRTKYKFRTRYKKIAKFIQKKCPAVKDKPQMKQFLKEVDTLLGKLPKKEIEHFSKSKDFKLYKEMLNKYGVN